MAKSNGYRRPIPKENPALTKAKIRSTIKKEIDEAHLKGVEFAILTMKLFSYRVLSDKFGFNHEQLEKFADALRDLGDSLYKDYITVEDILTVCMEEDGLKFSFEDLQRIDPDFNKFQKVEEEGKS